MKRMPWHDRLVLAAAIWLAVSPFALGTPSLEHPATIAAFVCAALLVGCASDAPPIADPVQEWVVITVGLGLVASPWYLEYAPYTAATINAVAVGTIVAVCAFSGMLWRSGGALSAEREHRSAH